MADALDDQVKREAQAALPVLARAIGLAGQLVTIPPGTPADYTVQADGDGGFSWSAPPGGASGTVEMAISAPGPLGSDFNPLQLSPLVAGQVAQLWVPYLALPALQTVSVTVAPSVDTTFNTIELVMFNADQSEGIVMYTPSPVALPAGNSTALPFTDVASFGQAGTDVTLVDSGGDAALKTTAGGQFAFVLSVQPES